MQKAQLVKLSLTFLNRQLYTLDIAEGPLFQKLTAYYLKPKNHKLQNLIDKDKVSKYLQINKYKTYLLHVTGEVAPSVHSLNSKLSEYEDDKS